jgi:hypothetical protein
MQTNFCCPWGDSQGNCHLMFYSTGNFEKNKSPDSWEKLINIVKEVCRYLHFEPTRQPKNFFVKRNFLNWPNLFNKMASICDLVWSQCSKFIYPYIISFTIIVVHSNARNHNILWTYIWVCIATTKFSFHTLYQELIGVSQGCQMVLFKQKIQIWVNFGGPWNGKVCYIL